MVRCRTIYYCVINISIFSSTVDPDAFNAQCLADYAIFKSRKEEEELNEEEEELNEEEEEEIEEKRKAIITEYEALLDEEEYDCQEGNTASLMCKARKELTLRVNYCSVSMLCESHS